MSLATLNNKIKTLADVRVDEINYLFKNNG